MGKFKVRKMQDQFVVGREQKNNFGSIEFVLSRYGQHIFKSKTAAEKRAAKLNE